MNGEALVKVLALHVGGVSYPDDCGICNEALPCETAQLVISHREALEKLAAEWKQSADEDERYLNKAHASEIHDVYASIRINREHADALREVAGKLDTLREK